MTETAAFVAHFQIKSYTITIEANPNNGGTVDGGGTYEYGQSCTVHATEANGYHFVNWTENGGQVSSGMEYTFIVTGDRDLVANFFAEDYIIFVEIEPENGGTVTGAGGYNYDDECTLKATANEGYDFVNWTKEDGTVVSADATYSFTVTESASFVAHFQIRSYTVTVSANPNNGGSVYVGNTPGATQGTYNSGQYCTVHAIANSGYRFANWTENDSVVANYATYDFHVTSDRELVANFTRVYTISVSANPPDGGTVTGSGFYEEGETCRVTAAANPNFTFVNWMDGSQVASTDAEYTFTVTGNRTLVAHFEPQAGNYTISVSANPTNGGLVHVGSPTGPTTGTYNSGQSCTIYATANEHYTFTNWKKGNSVVSTNSTYTFQVTESATYTAYFTQDPQYTITASANPTNGGSVSGGGTYYQGETCNLTATAASNYSFDHWTRNGTTISGGTTISFNVTENATYIAYFITVPTVTTNNATNIQQTTATGGGNVTNSGGATVTRRGVCWSTSQNPSLDNGSSYQDASSGGTGTFTVPMTGLTPGTHYYVRAYATNSAGTGYGSQEEFDTQAQQYTISVSANPSNGGTVTGGGTFNQGQQCTVHANPNGNYTFTNWTENGSVASTQANYTFTVTGNRTLVANFTSNSGNHAYVDLGLPSGLLWATCNVGADNPEDYGDYFAWGETQPKSVYNWSTYQYCMGSENTLTKYCNNASYGYNGFTDNLTLLELGDDAATVNWGGNWHMPTEAEWEELRNNTTVTWTPQNGVNGCRFTASNGNSIFLPAAGYRYESGLIGAGSNGHYWSSSLINTLDPNTPDYARDLFFYYSVYDGVEYYIVYHTRMCGRSVRPVRSARQD